MHIISIITNNLGIPISKTSTVYFNIGAVGLFYN